MDALRATPAAPPSAPVAIRPATLADLPRMVTMGLHFLRSSAYRHVMAERPDQMASLGQCLVTSPTSIILVAEQDREAVGMLGLVAYPHFISGELTVGEVFWWMEHKARGTGLRLLRAGEAWARAQGAVTLQMIAPDDRVGAVYRRLGYAPIEQTFLRRLDVV